MKKVKENKTSEKSFAFTLTILGGIIGVYLILVTLETFIFTDRFGPFAKIAGINVGGQTKTTAVATVTGAWDRYQNQEVEVDGTKYSPKELVAKVDVEKSVTEALERQDQETLSFGLFRQKEYNLELTLNDPKISAVLAAEFDKKTLPAEDAKIILTPTTQIVPEKVGQRLLLPESRENIQNGLGHMTDAIDLRTEKLEPMLTATEAKEEINEAKEAANTDITVNSELGDFTISRNELATWVKISSKKEKSLAFKADFLPVDTEAEKFDFFDEAKVVGWTNDLATKLNRPAKNATLGVTNGQVRVISASQTGYSISKTDLVNQIQAAATGSKNIQLKITKTEPDVTEAKIADMGVKELISTGYSDFAGSPVNRKVNIAVGASKFNGVIIKPGEDFSFNKALGSVDASTGYLPELVIKQDKTVPEYGGGLCQVSSTAFRAALNSGLPITERHAHAYPVSYYKPYGVDATIYLPWPDLRFTNDTGHYILIQTHIDGTKLTFDFYGTEPARSVKFAGNVNANGASDIVEKVTPAITEAGARGNNSFTASLYRFIYNSDGKLIRTDPFVSKYDSPDKYPH